MGHVELKYGMLYFVKAFPRASLWRVVVMINIGSVNDCNQFEYLDVHFASSETWPNIQISETKTNFLSLTDLSPCFQ
jgi:hypothetical protein